MKKFVASLVVLSVAVIGLASVASARPVFVQKADNFVVLYDTSGSMAQTYKDTGKSKFFLAEQMLKTLVLETPELEYQAGLYDFTPFKAYYSMKPFDKSAYARAVISLPDEVPGGSLGGASTPFGTALRNLNEVLDGTTGKTIVYIISDGDNTDDLNPYREAKKVSEQHDVCFYMVNLGPWEEGNTQMQKISHLGGCSTIINFDDAIRDPGVLAEPLYSVVEVAEPEETVIIEEVFVEETPEVLKGMVHFGFESAQIEDRYSELLEKVGVFMKNNPETVCEVSGNTDSTGPASFNLWLSKQRAMAVRDYLVKKFDLSEDRFVLNWYGEGKPIAPNDSKQGRWMNRRASITVQ
ncbi:MAG: OmpA family protein [Desulfovibrionaceae bacterium]